MYDAFFFLLKHQTYKYKIKLRNVSFFFTWIIKEDSSKSILPKVQYVYQHKAVKYCVITFKSIEDLKKAIICS